MTTYQNYIIRPAADGYNAIWFEHKDWDGTGDVRCGYADNEEEARDLIDDQIADLAEAVRKRRRRGLDLLARDADYC